MVIDYDYEQNNDIHEYSTQLLRNVEVQCLKEFLKPIIPRFNQIFSLTDGNGWAKCVILLNQLLSQGTDDTEFDEQVFDNIYWNQDHVYICGMNTEETFESIQANLLTSPAFNRKLRIMLPTYERLSSIRIRENKIVLLFRLGTANLGRSGEQCTFFVPCCIDFDRSIITIRLREHYLTKSSLRLKDVLSEIRHYINNNLNLGITALAYNETELHRILYRLFSDESENAEEIIRQNIDNYCNEKTNEDISNFLETTFGMTENANYIERIKSVLYQDTSTRLDDSEFYNGFIFGFTFFDRNFIKSLTRNPSHEPVYNSKVYWNLKDLVHEYMEIKHISLYWRFDQHDFEAIPQENDFLFVEISLEEVYGLLEVHYYNIRNIDMKEVKEEYVTQKIESVK